MANIRTKSSIKVEYSTKEISKDLVLEIVSALKGIRWGSLEIYIQNSQVVQITERKIKKVNGVSSDNVKKKQYETRKL